MMTNWAIETKAAVIFAMVIVVATVVLFSVRRIENREERKGK